MKRYYFQILLACCLTLFAGCSDSDSESGQNGIPKGSKAIDLQQDRSGLLRNPCMGWGLYDDAVSKSICNRLRVYADVNNPCVWTNWKGQDPETDSNTNAYPNVTSFSIGVDISF